MSSSKKRKLEDAFGDDNVSLRVPVYQPNRLKVRNTSWSTLSKETVEQRATVTQNYYKVQSTGKFFFKDLSHSHGEFNKRVPMDLELQTHNLSTSELGSAPRSFPKIVNRLSSDYGASDVLRVIKGTHITKGLRSDDRDERWAAIEMGTEIGTSEFVRGGAKALLDASVNLYRIKHGNLKMRDFSSHELGYTGSGKGGAERLRKLGDFDDIMETYHDPLREIYDSHASRKQNRPWETGLRKNASKSTRFMAWQKHKMESWTKRVGDSDEVPTYEVPELDVKRQPWSELAETVSESRVLVARSKYKISGRKAFETVDTSHTHGEFNKRIDDDTGIETHNVSTSMLGSAPRSFPKLLQRMDRVSGATDTLRVLKGTHLSKGLIGDTQEKRKAAMEMGTEIGVSEYLRGGTNALVDASINLYRMKHGQLTKTNFAKPTVGYIGAGKGGAERLRNLDKPSDVFARHTNSLARIYEAHASSKPNRPWESSLGKKATPEQKFVAWQEHKFKSWTQRN
jgi:hypothetical protein